ncbi:MAG: TIGR04255 family protein [Acidobacteria bacterium]|nr:TIGR04255 family protein [Acidobacteriota bacterium]
MKKRTLPDYESPPAQETWMSFHFVPLNWSIPHFGAFWNEIRNDYPKFEVHPPLGEFTLELNAMSPEAAINLPVRCWFINETDNRLIQVQNTRFFHNWRKAQGKPRYYHYAELKPHFQQEWNRFRAFVEKYELGPITVLGCEVSYVNHLDRGEGWRHFSELETLFPKVGSFEGRVFLGKPEIVAFRSVYVMPGNEARLTLQAQPAVRQSDGREIIQFSVTGTCRPSSQEEAELYLCLDHCREWVVMGFDDFTSEAMHKIWRKK